MIFEHHCRACDLDWLEEYSVKDNPPETCPECRSTDVYRCVTTAGAIIFKGGGWSPDGYYNYKNYDTLKETGHKVKLYDRKEDLDREMQGEKREAELKKLKRQNEVAKRTMGPDAGITQKEADKVLKDV